MRFHIIWLQRWRGADLWQDRYLIAGIPNRSQFYLSQWQKTRGDKYWRQKWPKCWTSLLQQHRKEETHRASKELRILTNVYSKWLIPQNAVYEHCVEGRFLMCTFCLCYKRKTFGQPEVSKIFLNIPFFVFYTISMKGYLTSDKYFEKRFLMYTPSD